MASLSELLSRFDPTLPLEQARTIPAAWYLDADLYEAERRRVFADCWLAVGRADQVAEPGSFFTAEVAGEPLVVARDGEGVLHGFVNVCRHRAARVACEEQGRATRFRCRYHGWTYDLTGRLRGTPEFAGVADFAPEDNGLPPIHVAERGPLVWAHLGAAAPAIDDWLAPLTRRGTFERLAGFRWHARREYRLACNWKVFVDNYLDGGYHVNTIHPGLAGVLDYTGYRTEIDGDASVQISPMKSKDEAVRAVRTGEYAHYWWLFPNFMLNVYDTAADTNVVLPDGVGRCRVVFDFYFRDVGPQFAEESVRVAEQVQAEDVGICEEVQGGLASRSYDTGRFSVRREAGGYHFHQLLARRLAATAV